MGIYDRNFRRNGAPQPSQTPSPSAFTVRHSLHCCDMGEAAIYSTPSIMPVNSTWYPSLWVHSELPRFLLLKSSWRWRERRKTHKLPERSRALHDALVTFGSGIHTEDRGEYERLKKLVEKRQDDLDQARREFERGIDSIASIFRLGPWWATVTSIL